MNSLHHPIIECPAGYIDGGTCADLGRSKPETLRALTAEEHFKWFHSIASLDVWTADGWLVTAVQDDGVTHHLRKGNQRCRAIIQPDAVLYFNGNAFCREHNIGHAI
jgi:hypothetical protein